MAIDYTRKACGTRRDPSKFKELNSRELHAVEILAALDVRLRASESCLEERMKSMPGTWRDYRLAMTMLEKALDAVYLTVPDKTMRRFMMLFDHGEIVIRPKPAATAGAYVQIIDNKDFKVILNRAIEGDCAMCLKSGGEAKACPLRRALMTIVPPEELVDDGMCPFQHVAQGNELGKYV